MCIRDSGQTVYTTDIIVDDQEFTDSKGQGGNTSYSRSSGPYVGGGEEDLGEGFMNIPDGVEDCLLYTSTFS